MVQKATGSDLKGQLSILAYLTAIGAAFFFPPAAIAIYVAVAAMWLIPDRRFERIL